MLLNFAEKPHTLMDTLQITYDDKTVTTTSAASHLGRQTTLAAIGPEVRISSVTDGWHNICPCFQPEKAKHVSQPIKGNVLLLLSPPTAPPSSNQSTPRAFPLFYSKAYPQPCLLLSLCQRRVMVVDFFAVASAD